MRNDLTRGYTYMNLRLENFELENNVEKNTENKGSI